MRVGGRRKAARDSKEKGNKRETRSLTLILAPFLLIRRAGGVMAEAEEKGAPVEGKENVVERVAVLDFDMLCATVALQTQGFTLEKRRMGMAAEEEDGEKSGEFDGLQRMWEGHVLDCFEDRRIAIESGCCPCYRFGRNMRRANLGSCFLQGTVYFVLALLVLFNLTAFGITKRYSILFIGVASVISFGIYLGYFRTRMRKQFNIRGSDNYLDDCVNHLICPCCTLCQGTVYFVLALLVLFNLTAFGITKRYSILFIGVASVISFGIYLGYFRTRMRKQFNIRGSDNYLDDCVNHLICPCCTLCQESRTLEMNNVQDGVWHGRGDTICLRTGGEGNKAFVALQKPPLMPTGSPGLCSMERKSDGDDRHSEPLLPSAQLEQHR
ncbi:hypothetical protein COCNU_06G010470 [Cocos nucifera]|uniref:Uncharacterized protein n=1 Tax=Cocos nucifera TaxID=13894 RepID=A0A8K0IBC9_COCNU|nr:hypothetical protein COCNU_06G010470 [Cocos nucifera]